MAHPSPFSRLSSGTVPSGRSITGDKEAAFSILSVGTVSILPEVCYRLKGAANVQEFNQQLIDEGSAEIGLDYIEVPVLLRIDLGSLAGGQIVPYINGGPAFGWRFDCSISLDAEGDSTTRACDDLASENIEETLRDYELGAAFGGGFGLPGGGSGGGPGMLP